jgi:hypothetical protein
MFSTWIKPVDSASLERTPDRIEPVGSPAKLDFQAALDRFVAEARQQTGCQLSTMILKRYVRIVETWENHRTVWAFIDMTNGDVLQSDGWKRPGIARGNIFSDRHGMEAVFGKRIVCGRRDRQRSFTPLSSGVTSVTSQSLDPEYAAKTDD